MGRQRPLDEPHVLSVFRIVHGQRMRPAADPGSLGCSHDAEDGAERIGRPARPRTVIQPVELFLGGTVEGPEERTVHGCAPGQLRRYERRDCPVLRQ